MEFILKELIILLLVTFSAAAHDFVVKPAFVEKEQDLHVTAYVGQTSRLPCTVKHLSGKRVSWIRERDLQVLSTGRHTVSTDLRISVLSGRRLKPRSSRDLAFPMQFRGRALERTGGYLKDPGTGDWMIKPSAPERSYSHLEDEDRIRIYDPYFISIRRRTSPMKLVSKNSSGYYHNHILLNENKKVKRLKRNVTGHYIFKIYRTGNEFDNNNPWINTDSSSNEKRNWYKETMQSDDHKTRNTIKCLDTIPETRCESKEQFPMDIEVNNPIAIYPPDPVTKATEPKSLKLSPYYIPGVWEPEDYTLQIKYAKPQDSGTYICQINTEPRIVQAVLLRVVEMKAEIVGRRELFVNAGNPSYPSLPSLTVLRISQSMRRINNTGDNTCPWSTPLFT
ncbi:uncharacterized protein [Palaemon carinicauda]|uniref:uncharacterized protein n=1 Tax=Palaemon carinicauda TaxID=392227 RepID=UPI0035B689C1